MEGRRGERRGGEQRGSRGEWGEATGGRRGERRVGEGRGIKSGCRSTYELHMFVRMLCVVQQPLV